MTCKKVRRFNRRELQIPYDCGCSGCIDLTVDPATIPVAPMAVAPMAVAPILAAPILAAPILAAPVPMVTATVPVILPEKKEKKATANNILPFSLNFGKDYSNWTDPYPSTGQRKNNCVIDLDPSSVESKDVVGMFLQSIREGKEKFASEHSKGIDSAACNFYLFLFLR